MSIIVRYYWRSWVNCRDVPSRVTSQQLTLNQRVQGSSPCAPTNFLRRLGSKVGDTVARLAQSWEKPARKERGTPSNVASRSIPTGQVKQYVPTRVGFAPSHGPQARSSASSVTSKTRSASSGLSMWDLLMAPLIKSRESADNE